MCLVERVCLVKGEAQPFWLSLLLDTSVNMLGLALLCSFSFAWLEFFFEVVRCTLLVL